MIVVIAIRWMSPSPNKKKNSLRLFFFSTPIFLEQISSFRLMKMHDSFVSRIHKHLSHVYCFFTLHHKKTKLRKLAFGRFHVTFSLRSTGGHRCRWNFHRIGFSVQFYIKNHLLNNFFESIHVSMCERKQESRKSSQSLYGKITWENA